MLMISWGLVRFIYFIFTWFARWLLVIISLAQRNLRFLIRRHRFHSSLQRSFGNEVDFLDNEEIGKQLQRWFRIDRKESVEVLHSILLCVWLSYSERNLYKPISKVVFDVDCPHGKYAMVLTKSHIFQ